MTQEEKAKAYDEALKRAIKHHNKDGLTLEQYETIDIIFPELKESKDERKDIIVLVKDWWDRVNKDNISTKEQMLAWLEKQKSVEEIVERCRTSWYNEGKIAGMAEGLTDDEKYQQGWHDALEKQGEQKPVNFEEAEKEKSDFVSGKFIQCRKSFNEFKEDNSYWLEYIGDDIYIGRSDNILNQKFHITPRQLYRLFSQEHCIKNNNEETNAPFGYEKYSTLEHYTEQLNELKAQKGEQL